MTVPRIKPANSPPRPVPRPSQPSMAAVVPGSRARVHRARSSAATRRRRSLPRRAPPRLRCPRPLPRPPRSRPLTTAGTCRGARPPRRRPRTRRPRAAPAPSVDDLSATTVLPPKKSSPGLAAPPIPRVDAPEVGGTAPCAVVDDADRPTRVRESSEVAPPPEPRGRARAAPETPLEEAAQASAEVPSTSTLRSRTSPPPPSTPSAIRPSATRSSTSRSRPRPPPRTASHPSPRPTPSVTPWLISPRGLLGLEDVAGLTPPPPPAADVLAELGTEDYRPGDVIAGKYKLTGSSVGVAWGPCGWPTTSPFST